ncbi:hypothetical protein D1007_19407 [Hordeum vulgare]|nr:hypothetical protein D1007_19407 [Hordeum vulgare]
MIMAFLLGPAGLGWAGLSTELDRVGGLDDDGVSGPIYKPARCNQTPPPPIIFNISRAVHHRQHQAASVFFIIGAGLCAGAVNIVLLIIGKWVCGMCAEAVKERQQRDPDLAVDATAALRQGFNSTVRLNPKLSLASSMRNIARKSCQNRATGSGSCTAAGNSSDAMCCCAGRATSRALPYV